MALHRAIHARPPPLAQEGPPSSPGQGATPPPQGTAALGGPRPAPGGLSGFAPEPARPSHAPPSPAAALGPARSPPRRPANSRDPGPRALVPSPARPPGIPPAGPVPVRFGREGTARRSPRLHQDSPPWMTLGGIRPRRAGCGPHR